MTWTPVNTSAPATWPGVNTDVFYTYYLLQEDGAFLLQEDSSKIVTAYVKPTWPEITTPAPSPWTPI